MNDMVKVLTCMLTKRVKLTYCLVSKRRIKIIKM